MSASTVEAQRWNAGPLGTEGDQSSSATDSSADMSALVVRVDEILVGDRFRKDMGDVSELAASIAEIGLLNPVTVTSSTGGYRLIAGERRLRACVALEMDTIPVRVARDIIEARDMLIAERDENTQRKPMLPSEATALGMAIEEMERPAALDRMLAGTPRVPGPEGKEDLRPRDIAAEAIGMGEATYRRIKSVMNVALDQDESEEVREVARDALARIDAGEAIRPNVERVKETRRKTESTTVETTPKKRANDPTDYLQALADKYPTYRAAFEAEAHERYSSADSLESSAYRSGVKWQFTEKQWAARAEQSRDILDRSTLAINAAIDALSERVDFTTITPEQAVEALERIDMKRLSIYVRTLKEITQ